MVGCKECLSGKSTLALALLTHKFQAISLKRKPQLTLFLAGYEMLLTERWKVKLKGRTIAFESF
jgi:hypothetical protein